MVASGFCLDTVVFAIGIVVDAVAAREVEGEGIRVVEEFGHPFKLHDVKLITLPIPQISIYSTVTSVNTAVITA